MAPSLPRKQAPPNYYHPALRGFALAVVLRVCFAWSWALALPLGAAAAVAFFFLSHWLTMGLPTKSSPGVLNSLEGGGCSVQ